MLPAISTHVIISVLCLSHPQQTLRKFHNDPQQALRKFHNDSSAVYTTKKTFASAEIQGRKHPMDELDDV